MVMEETFPTEISVSPIISGTDDMLGFDGWLDGDMAYAGDKRVSRGCGLWGFSGSPRQVHTTKLIMWVDRGEVRMSSPE